MVQISRRPDSRKDLSLPSLPQLFAYEKTPQQPASGIFVPRENCGGSFY